MCLIICWLCNIFERFLKVLEDEKVFENESEVEIKWLSVNDMLVYPGEVEAMVLCRKKSFTNKYGSKINYTHIGTKSSVTLLGVEIDHNFIFKGNAQFIFLCNPQKSSVNV